MRVRRQHIPPLHRTTCSQAAGGEGGGANAAIVRVCERLSARASGESKANQRSAMCLAPLLSLFGLPHLPPSVVSAAV